jgi:hypothetical protein
VYNDLSQWISYESKLQLRALKDLAEKELDPTSDQKLRGIKVIGKRVKRKMVKTERKESLKLLSSLV